MAASTPSDTRPAPSLNGLSYLVVGGSSGIGLAVSRRLGARGARVVATGRDAERLARLESMEGVEFRVLADAAEFDVMDALVRDLASERDERLSGVVNCAGSILLRPAHLTSASDLENTLRQNLVTAFSLVRAAGRHLADGGSTVLISTAAVRMGLTAHEAVAAAKGGVEGLVRAAAATYAPRSAEDSEEHQ